jgi:phospholipid/cholesterol/gamma-HCH transport system permease protein
MATQAAIDSPRRAPASPSSLTLALAFVGESFLLFTRALGFILRGRLNARLMLQQMAAIGVNSLPIVVVTTLSTGGVFALYTSPLFVRLGAVSFLGGTLTLSFLLELGPVLAGVTVASRSGAAIAAEIGSMVVTEQVDALRSLGISPVRYLVAPRLAAAVLMMPLVTVFADLAGVLGCYLMAASNGVPSGVFLESVRQMVTESDFFSGLIKTFFFGAIIATVACQQGLRTSGGATGVGRFTTASVVLCVVLIFISDFFLAQVLSSLLGRK